MYIKIKMSYHSIVCGEV